MRQSPRAPANAECFLSRPRPPLGPARLPFRIICSSHPPPSPSSVDTQRYALGVLSGLRASGLGFPHGDTPARSSSRLVRLRAGPSRPFRAGSATRLARVSCDRASARPFRAPPSLQRLLTLQKETAFDFCTVSLLPNTGDGGRDTLRAPKEHTHTQTKGSALSAGLYARFERPASC